MNSRDDDVIVLSSEDASDQAAPPSDEEPRAGWSGSRDSAGPPADYAVGSSGVATPADEAGDTEVDDTEAEDAEIGDTEASDTEASDAEVGDIVAADTAVSPEPAAADTLAADVTAPDASSRAQVGDAWPQIQALFVDDPRGAVRQAADVASGAVTALVTAARNREQALGGWEDGGTEELRSALRDFRDLASRAEALAREL